MAGERRREEEREELTLTPALQTEINDSRIKTDADTLCTEGFERVLLVLRA